MRSWLNRTAFERGGLLALATLVVYLWIAPPYIVDGDNAEFATLGSVGGVAHPSGYPLYLIWLRVTSWLPGDNPAHTAALATAILGAGLVMMIQAACRAWGARPLSASLAAAIFAGGPVVLRIHTEAEVFALNGLVVATVLWLAAAGGPLRGHARIAALGLVAGLGLSNHLTCVLVAPIGLLGAVRGVREATSPRLVSAALGIGGLVVGLSPYLYLLATRETLISWGRIDDLGGIVHHFLRMDYGGPGKFSPRGTEVPMTESLAALAATIGRAWLWLPLAVGLGTLVLRIARPRGPESRWAWSLLAVSVVLAGPVLASRFNVTPEGIGLYICQRFHLLPALLLALPIAVGFDRVTERLRSPVLGGVVATVTFAAVAGLALPFLLRVHSPAVELGLRNTLRSLPPDAVVIGVPDLFHFGMGYLQAARGERPDVTVVAWPQIPSEVYRARLKRRGVTIVPTADGVQSVDAAAQVLATGRPLFIDAYGSNIAQAFPTYPYGILFRVLPKGSPPPPIEEVYALNRRLFEAFELGYEVPGTDAEFATELHELYARVWRILAQGLGAAGHREEQAIAAQFAAALEPRD